MATSSIFHNIVIKTEEEAKRFVEALEKAMEKAGVVEDEETGTI